MDYKDTLSQRKWLSKWLKKKPKGSPLFHLSHLSDTEEDKNDQFCDIDVHPVVEKDYCDVSNEFRIFVGTWNVAGRLPVGNLAVDLDDWLNLKDAAGIYVLSTGNTVNYGEFENVGPGANTTKRIHGNGVMVLFYSEVSIFTLHNYNWDWVPSTGVLAGKTWLFGGR